MVAEAAANQECFSLRDFKIVVGRMAHSSPVLGHKQCYFVTAIAQILPKKQF
jgi:hypothetical protein